MNNEVYKVSRDEYAGVIAQINPQTSDVETYHEDWGTSIKVKNKQGLHFTTRLISNDGEEEYYVFNLPRNEDCLPPKRIRKIELKTQEEVQSFFNALNKIQKEKQND